MHHFRHTKRKKRIRGTAPALQERARELRREMTPAERVLWKALRWKQLGVRFRRQHAVGSVILDFYCPSCKLVVEVDGGAHEERVAEDQARTEHLQAYGYRTIRFNNEAVLNDLPRVLERIREAIDEPERFLSK